MIPADKNAKFTEAPESLKAQLSQTLSDKNEKEEVQTNSKSRSSQINICIPQETKTEWKILFAKNNVSITQGIIFAIEHLKNEIENGDVTLTVGGVMRKS